MRLRPTRFWSARPRPTGHWFITLALLAFTAIAGSAAADSDSGCSIGCRPLSDYTESFKEYLDATRSHFLTGLNSVITSPADPVMSVVEPLAEYKELPAGSVTGRFVGAIQGSVLAVYRGSTGLLDMLFAPMPIAILSPEPRYQPIPGFEWEE